MAVDRLLILSASAGAGHVRAADALVKAAGEARAAREIIHYDILKYSAGLMRALYSRTYFKLVNAAPELLGWMYHRTDQPWKLIRRRTVFDRANLRRMIWMIEKADPDLILCTHFTPAEVVSWLKHHKRLRGPQGIVITDLDAHGMWMVPTYERYFVAREETKVYLASTGVPAARIGVTGIPIDPVFARPKDRAVMRRRLGLPAGRPVVLVSAGGNGAEAVEAILRPMKGMRTQCVVIAMCGRNESMRKRLAPYARARGPVEFRVMGYTTAMDEWMAAADLMVGKPGGLTTSEALARGLPLAVVSPIPGQEERNSDVLLEEGAAIRCNNLPAIGWKIDALLGEPRRLAALKRNAKRIGRPHAARDVIRQALELVR
ncbi:MAG: glycosyltransferase [Candidatus Coatesbacteria bacterium]